MQYRIYDRKNAPHPNFPFFVEEGTDATLSARAGEEYAFCIGVQPESDGIFRVTYEPLAGAEGRPAIAETAFDSVSFGGIDYRGNPFEKELVGIKGQRRLLWFTVQVPDDAAGTYRGGLVLGCDEDSARVPLLLSVAGFAADRGWDEPEKLTRLSWLNDTTAQTGGATVPFTQPTLQGNTVGILGRDITVTPTGLPGEIATYFVYTPF